MHVLTLRPRRHSTARGILTVGVLPQMRSIMLRSYALSAALAFALSTVTSSVASSQGTGTPTAANLDVRPGDRVRVVAPEYGDTAQIGTIAAVGDDGIVLRGERQDDSRTIPFAHLRQLDVSQGHSAHPVTGLVIGLAAGAVGGAVLGLSTPIPRLFPAYDGGIPLPGVSRGGLTATGALLGGVAGAVIGVVTGALIHTERWDTLVPLHSLADHAHASVDLIPSPMGPRLAARVAVRF
jgi:hypothetical protein